MCVNTKKAVFYRFNALKVPILPKKRRFIYQPVQHEQKKTGSILPTSRKNVLSIYHG
jgi:hypothetical protein